ncbi:DUF3780 domain-containing protein [Mesorhizobium sp. M0643]|uniref:DUF3780 domain-containing protein n=1 Tax=Mesorhizobium sp. M0643 TaxID=2956978 RepID=UPI003335A2DD
MIETNKGMRVMSGFDCADHYLEHCYLVQVPRGPKDDVHVFEVFGRRPKETEESWGPEAIHRANVVKAKWDAISGEIRLEFNRRLKSERKKAGSWSLGNNAVQRLLGKELLVLVWAVEGEDISIEQCEVAIRNWIGFKPEERWWLYTMTAASTGYAHQTGLGWRGALAKALCFGTKQDVFSLGSMMGRGQLPPRRNDDFQSDRNSERTKLESAALKAIASNGTTPTFA